MNLFLLCVLLIATACAKPQVPYDYIPLGRKANPPAHASDVQLHYERLFPSRRRWQDDLPPRRELY